MAIQSKFEAMVGTTWFVVAGMDERWCFKDGWITASGKSTCHFIHL